MKIGLALGGGAARGLAHIGVIRVLEEEGIPIHAIGGTSMGAIIGSKYALTPSVKVLEEDLQRFLESNAFREAQLDFLREGEEEKKGFFFQLSRYISKRVYYTMAANQQSLIKKETFKRTIDFLIPDVPMAFTRIPFAATAVDLNRGKEIVLHAGPLREAIAASCALPGVVPPMKIGDYELVDGGWLNLVPASVARSLGAHLVVGVWVGSELEETFRLGNSIDIFSRADEISRHYLGGFRLRECDVVVAPAVGHMNWADFKKAQEIIKAGEEAAEKAVPAIKKAIRKTRFKRWFFLSRSAGQLEIPFEVYPQ
jgi:NTE family protein